MWQILGIIVALLSPSEGDVEAFRQSAPAYLTTETARDNLSAARFAAFWYGVDPDVVLSIAHHESRYEVKAVTNEPGNRISCGVMTPEPTYDKKKCLAATTDVFAGYMAGAEHLRGWFDACRGNQRCALLGYAGGYYLIGECKKGPHLRHGDSGDDLCRTDEVFLWRARYIEGLRTKPAKPAQKASS
jgi:soluble lytic murein transglycosylase-like protein